MTDTEKEIAIELYELIKSSIEFVIKTSQFHKERGNKYVTYKGNFYKTHEDSFAQFYMKYDVLDYYDDETKKEIPSGVLSCAIEYFIEMMKYTLVLNKDMADKLGLFN